MRLASNPQPLSSTPRLDGVARAVPCVPNTIITIVVVAAHATGSRIHIVCVTAAYATHNDADRT
jgi:hypothetical protein